MENSTLAPALAQARKLAQKLNKVPKEMITPKKPTEFKFARVVRGACASFNLILLPIYPRTSIYANIINKIPTIAELTNTAFGMVYNGLFASSPREDALSNPT